MIDSLINCLPKIENRNIYSSLNLAKGDYILVTFHRPSNIDSDKNLVEIINLLNRLSEKKSVVFPAHPRTKNKINGSGLSNILSKKVILTDSIEYLDFIALINDSALVITDSGGIQEETTFLGVQCITTRKTTERPITADIGTNIIVGENCGKAYENACNILNGIKKHRVIPDLWDGKSSTRIVNILLNNLMKINII